MVMSNEELASYYHHWLKKYRDHKAGLAPPSLMDEHWREFYRQSAVKYGNAYKKRTGSVLQGFNEVRLR